MVCESCIIANFTSSNFSNNFGSYGGVLNLKKGSNLVVENCIFA